MKLFCVKLALYSCCIIAVFFSYPEAALLIGWFVLYYAEHFKLYSGFCANHIKVQKGSGTRYSTAHYTSITSYLINKIIDDYMLNNLTNLMSRKDIQSASEMF